MLTAALKRTPSRNGLVGSSEDGWQTGNQRAVDLKRQLGASLGTRYLFQKSSAERCAVQIFVTPLSQGALPLSLRQPHPACAVGHERRCPM